MVAASGGQHPVPTPGARPADGRASAPASRPRGEGSREAGAGSGADRLPPVLEARAWAGRWPGTGRERGPLCPAGPHPSDHGRWAERRSGLPGAGAAPAGSWGFGAPAARVWALGPAGRRALPHRLHLLVLTTMPAADRRLSPSPAWGPSPARPVSTAWKRPRAYWRPLVGSGLALLPCPLLGHQNQTSAPASPPGCRRDLALSSLLATLVGVPRAPTRERAAPFLLGPVTPSLGA